MEMKTINKIIRTKDSNSLAKLLQNPKVEGIVKSVGIRFLYLAISIFCICYIKMIFNFIHEILYGWFFIVGLSFFQVPFPEISGVIGNLTNLVVELMKTFFKIITLLIDVLIIAFIKTPYKNNND